MAMLLNTREWLRAGSLATIALICGLALRTPKQGDAAESAPPSRSSLTDLSDACASVAQVGKPAAVLRSEEHAAELHTPTHVVCCLPTVENASLHTASRLRDRARKSTRL